MSGNGLAEFGESLALERLQCQLMLALLNASKKPVF